MDQGGERPGAEMRVSDGTLAAVAGEDVFVSASIGSAVSPAEGSHPEDLARDADTAMYRAKALGGSCFQVFDAEMHASTVALLRLEASLRRALERSELRSTGVHLAIDDFGTGNSSLSYLHRLPFDSLRIDRSFISPVGTNGGEPIVAAIVALAHNLGMKVVAEGVESEAQVSSLCTLGCEFGQGFLWSEPVAAEQATALLAAAG